MLPLPFETARLRLRPVGAADLADLLKVNGNEEVTRHLPYGPWKSIEDADASFKRATSLNLAGLAWQYVLVEKSTGTVVGSCDLFHLEEDNGHAELGYVLGREYWGRGYMREALSALIDSVFRSQSLRKLAAHVESSNTASTRLLRHLGFRQEGLLRERWRTQWGSIDAEVFGLLRSDWEERAAWVEGDKTKESCHEQLCP